MVAFARIASTGNQYESAIAQNFCIIAEKQTARQKKRATSRYLKLE